MSGPHGIDPDWDRAMDPEERNALARVARRLDRERPVPQPGFRALLASKLAQQVDPDRPAPRRLEIVIAAYAGSAFVLLAVAVLGLAGAGPLSA